MVDHSGDAIENSSGGREINPFDTAFEHVFPLISLTMNRFIVDHMLRSARMLDLDFESLIILGLLSHLNVAPNLPLPGAAAPASGAGPLVIETFKPMRLRDLEQISRLPRETIRRKLQRLSERGYVESDAGGWRLRPDCIGQELREFTRDSAKQLLHLAEQMNQLIGMGMKGAGKEG